MTSKLSFIAKGTYGCVVSPGITRDNKIDTNIETISKLFINKDAFEEEIENYKIVISFIKSINKDEPIDKYTVQILNKSKLNKKNRKTLLSDDILTNCKKIKDLEPKLDIYQIEYENGGISLENLFESVNRTLIESIDILELLSSFNIVFEFLNLLAKNKYLHADIKLDNILFDINTNSIKVIDFGLVQHQDKIYSYEFMEFLKYHKLYPPEYIFTSNYFIYPENDESIKYEYFFFMDIFKLYLANIQKKQNINKKIKKIFTNFYKKFEEKYILTTETFTQLSKLFNHVKFTNLMKYSEENIAEYLDIEKELLQNLDSMEITETNSNKMLNNYIETICGHSPEQNIKEKIDVYMLGTAFLILLLKIFNSNIDYEYFNEDDNYIKIEQMFDLISQMVNPNPCERITIEKAYNIYSLIIDF